MIKLNIGDTSDNGQITIIDEDRLCYLVKSTSRGAFGLRTISKELLSEYVAYFDKHPDATANDARDALSGNSDIDKFEYGYTSTLKVMAQMALGQMSKTNSDSGFYQKENHPLLQIFSDSPNKDKFLPYLSALRTKPFMLLAGISGTGKSRIVRELAKAWWKEWDKEYGKNHPRNFCMVQVKPYWHDSSELFGYVSRISGKPEFVAGDFLKFVVKLGKKQMCPISFALMRWT